MTSTDSSESLKELHGTGRTPVKTNTATEGLNYALTADGTGYLVKGIGNATDTHIVIPDEYKGIPVVSIGFEAFYNCKSITGVTIGSKVTSINNEAFEHCEGITSIIIPEGVTSIGDSVFLGCSGLKNVTVAKGNEKYTDVDGVLFNKDRTSLICYPAGKSETTYNFPDGVTTIETYAFGYCHNITDISLPSSVKNICLYGFYGCYGLKSVNISEGLLTIGLGAFHGCSNLTSINIPCSVTSIEQGAFNFCESLTSITIPGSVTSIGDNLFYACVGLKSVSVAKDNTKYCDTDGILLSKDKTTLICYPAGKTDTSYKISDGVKNIGPFAFSYCRALTSVTIGNGVVYIGHYAFSYCDNLTDVNVADGVIYIGDGTFSGCGGLKSVVIPGSVTYIGNCSFQDCQGLTSLTLKNTDGWRRCRVFPAETIGTAVEGVSLADKSVAATFFKSTYRDYNWLCGI